MGHFVEDPGVMFRSVRYNTKGTADLRDAMKRKTVELTSQIESRESRVRLLRDEYHIDAERLASLVMQYQRDAGNVVSYNAQASRPGEAVVPAGVIANIIREHEMIDSERGQVRKLELILRNLNDVEQYVDGRSGEVRTRPCLHTLTDAELEFLGF